VFRWLLLAGWALLAGPGVAADEPAIDEPRAYGHVVGDLLTRTVRLNLPAGRRLDPDGLPRPGRVDAWLELHSIDVRPGAGSNTTLRLNYQVINVGADVVTTVLPALKLPLAPNAGAAAGEAIELPDWPVHLSPLTAPFAVSRGALSEMQPDIAPVREPLQPLLQRLALYGLLLCLLAGPWLLARFPQLAFWRRRAPFLAAWRDLKAWRAQEASAEATRHALTRLHAAFDATAGGAVFEQHLDALYAARPSLRPAAREIEAFFATSREVFFAQGAPGAWTPERVRDLAWKLAQLEGARR
jgi:mxaA protein